MEPWYFPLLAATGVVVGFLNVMAGGGSLISMPILIFLGLEPAMANGTNRVAILVQNITAVSSFRSQGYSGELTNAEGENREYLKLVTVLFEETIDKYKTQLTATNRSGYQRV